MSQKTNTFALLGLICGVIGLLGLVMCCCFPFATTVWFGLFGILAAIFGYLGKQQIEASGGQESGEQMATIALILGVVEIALAAVSVILVIFGVMGSVASSIFD